MTPRTLLRAAACLLAILPSPAPADSTGRLQFLYTAFMDVRGLAANTLEHCARDNPATQAMLQDLYQDWDRNHGRHQTELQMLIRAQLVAAIGPEQAEAFIDNARMQAHKQLAPQYFPQLRWRTAHTSAASCCPRPCGARCRCCALGSTCGNTGKRRRPARALAARACRSGRRDGFC
ncbi:hypothetical protein WJ968_33940 [Achromobacter xylosoxidans]